MPLSSLSTLPGSLGPGLLALPALAQAGGGGSFGLGRDGGGFGGGFDGDGDGVGMVLYLLLRLVLRYPAVGVPLLVVAAVVFVAGTRAGWWKHQERVIARQAPRRRAAASGRAAEALRAGDPDFDQVRFLARVRRAFELAQESWCAQDLEPLRPFVSDGVFERFALQIEEQREDGWRQGIDGLAVGALSIEHVSLGPHFETLVVRIPFQGDVHRVALASGERIPGSRIPRESFVECWSFVRRRGTRSLSGDGLIEGKCPNCAAPLAVAQSARCGHCGCLARSGRFDWVLAEITQASEWRAEDGAAVPGLAAYVARDPGLDAQLLEDRASVAFWRLRAAERAGDSGPLTRLADPELCRRVGERLAVAPGAPRTHPADCAVGSVRTLGVLAGEGLDRAVLEVVWDGRLARVEPGPAGAGGAGGAGVVRRVEGERRLARTLLVLARPAGRRTSLDEAFTTTHCSTCGAHDEGGTDPACAYCRAPRTGDGSAWLLHALHERGTREAEQLSRELATLRDVRGAPAEGGGPRGPGDRGTGGVHGARSPLPAAANGLATGPSAAGLLAWAVSLARADGGVDARERRALDALAARLEVPPERVPALLAADPASAAPEPRDAREARAWLHALAELALSDGSLGRGEQRLLARTAERLSLPRRDLDHALRAARTQLYLASRAGR